MGFSIRLHPVPFYVIWRTHEASKPRAAIATKVLDGLALAASERNDFSTVGRFFFRYHLAWKLFFPCQKARAISNNFLLPGKDKGNTKPGEISKRKPKPDLGAGDGAGILRAC